MVSILTLRSRRSGSRAAFGGRIYAEVSFADVTSSLWAVNRRFTFTVDVRFQQLENLKNQKADN